MLPDGYHITASLAVERKTMGAGLKFMGVRPIVVAERMLANMDKHGSLNQQHQGGFRWHFES